MPVPVSEKVLRTWNTPVMVPAVTPPINGASVSSGQINLENYDSIEGQVTCDVAGTITIKYRQTPTGNPIYTSSGDGQDLSQANFCYTWSEPIQAPYVEVIFTNTSGGPATRFVGVNKAKQR